MRYLFPLTIITTLMTYLLVFAGGVVRVAGAGLGCPDWPKCFGRWFPPTNINQLPDFIDPVKFNFVLAWIEYGNRLLGVIMGALILITFFVALRYFRNSNKIFLPILTAFLLTLIEGWLGGVLVKSMLNPITITLHLILALIIIGLLIYASMHVYYAKNSLSELKSEYHSKLKIFIIFLIAITSIEIILGTEIRAGLDIGRKNNPMVDSYFLLKMLGSFKYIHTILGIALIWIVFMIKKYVSLSNNPSPIINLSVKAIIFLILFQLIIGESLVFLRVEPLLQLFHLWGASLILGISVLQLTVLNRSSDNK